MMNGYFYAVSSGYDAMQENLSTKKKKKSTIDL